MSRVTTQAAVPRDTTLWEWISDPETWTGQGGIWESLVETVVLCAVVVAIAIAVAVPLAA